MTIHDRVLQDAYRAWMAKSDSSTHLDEAVWERLATSELGGDERATALKHVLACEECSQIWKALLALELQARADGLVPQVGAPRSTWASRSVPMALAATLLLAVSGWLLVRQPQPAADTVRSAPALAAVDGLMVAYSVAGVPTFVWTPLPEATHYRIEVFFEDGRPHWSAEMAAPPTPWPSDIARSKGAYRWRVEALNGDLAVARSRLMPVELAR